MGNAAHSVQTTFAFIPTIEFFTALYRSANLDLFLRKRREWDTHDGDRAERLLTDMHNSLSPFLQRELSFFFTVRDTMVDQAFHLFAFQNPSIETIPALLDVVDSADPETILQYLLQDIPEEDVKAELMEALCIQDVNVRASLSHRIEGFLATQDGRRISECMAYPAETKERFSFLLRGFYNLAFQPVERHLMETSAPAVGQFQNLFCHDASKFFATFVQTTPDAFEKLLKVHVSVLNPNGISSTFTAHPAVPDYLRLGMDTDRLLHQHSVDSTIELFTKAISDKRRLDILRLLARTPMYGQELATHLQITSAAVSYHMAFFFKLDLVHFEKEDNKVYYLLDRQRLEGLLHLLVDNLISF